MYEKYWNILDSGLLFGKDNRTNHEAFNKSSISALNLIKEHINSFPKVESNYCRRDSNKTLMYLLYIDYFCKEGNISLFSLFIYKQTLNSFDPLLSFFYQKNINVSLVMDNETDRYRNNNKNYWVQHKQRERKRENVLIKIELKC